MYCPGCKPELGLAGPNPAWAWQKFAVNMSGVGTPSLSVQPQTGGRCCVTGSGLAAPTHNTLRPASKLRARYNELELRSRAGLSDAAPEQLRCCSSAAASALSLSSAPALSLSSQPRLSASAQTQP